MVKKSNSADKTEPTKGKGKIGKLKVNKETVKDLTNSKATMRGEYPTGSVGCPRDSGRGYCMCDLKF